MTTLDQLLQRLRWSAVVLVLLFTLGRGAAAAVPMYTVEPIDGLDDVRSVPAINDPGQVSGAISMGSGSHAALWTAGIGVRDLHTLGAGNSQSSDINNAGQVVGYNDAWGGSWGHAFLWTPTGGMQDLGTLGGSVSWALGINNAGQVAGGSWDANSHPHAVLWTPGKGIQDLGSFAGQLGYAQDINDVGQVVGRAQLRALDGTGSQNWPQDSFSFLWSPTGGMQELSPLAFDTYRINNTGQMIVNTSNAGSDSHAFLWFPGAEPQPLGTLPGDDASRAYAINDAGQVVGRSWPQINTYATHAFLYSAETGLIDLNTRIDPALGWQLRTATGINNPGQIVGVGNFGVFRLSPDTLPPSSTAVLSPAPDKKGWNSGEVTVTLNAADNLGGCGVQQVTYSASGAQTIASTSMNGSSGSLRITALGTTTLTFFARDRAGNIETPKTTRIQIGKPAPPRAPSGLTVSDPDEGGSSRLDLAWKVNSDNETGFEIQRRGAGKDWTPVTVAPADTSSYTDTGLDAYTHYGYRVRAVNAGGSSAWSNEAWGDTGIRPLVRIAPDRLEFDRQPVGATSPVQTLTLTNAGNGPLELESILITGNGRGEFQLIDGDRPGTLQPGESQTLRVTFTPDSTGSWLAAVTIQSSAPDSPLQAPLSGAGVPGEGGGPSLKIGVSSLSVPDRVDFGPEWLGTSGAVKTLTLTNTGTAPLKIQRIALAGVDARDFAIAAGGGGTVAPRASRTLTLRFQPKALGSRSAILTIRSNADGSPHQIALGGTGVVPTAGEPGGGPVPSPTKVELLVGAIDGIPTHKAVISPGQCVRLKLRVKYRNGAVAELADDPSLQLSAAGARGPFTQTNVWCPQPGDAGRTITLVGRYTSPSGRQLLGKLTLTVRRAANTHQ
jgi:probable HAF family extracellular repeat protein